MRAVRIFLVLAAGLAATSDAAAQRPLTASWWSGLGAPKDAGRAEGVLVLKVPSPSRVHIPAGRFTMGSEPTDMQRALALCRREVDRQSCDIPGVSQIFRSEGHAHEVVISAFEMDRTEVTVGAYARCTAVGVCRAPGFTPGDRRFDRADLPVVMVSWDDAATYCKWSGGRLPTEAEWEFAARGPTAREYPWGAFYNPHLCNHGSFSGTDETDASDGFAGLAPVGSFPDGATPLGLLDMAGNAAEWVDGRLALDDELFGYPAAAQVNPSGVPEGFQVLPLPHVARGGSFMDGAAWMRGAARGGSRKWEGEAPLQRSVSIGFRCAYGGAKG
jgi:formylglycine-generating enzyme required for sulfatase activity